ncbi:hypothetical protein ACFLR2_00320 [Chlamydiota bacterium]
MRYRMIAAAVGGSVLLAATAALFVLLLMKSPSLPVNPHIIDKVALAKSLTITLGLTGGLALLVPAVLRLREPLSPDEYVRLINLSPLTNVTGHRKYDPQRALETESDSEKEEPLP